MGEVEEKRDIIAQLQQKILHMQGVKPAGSIYENAMGLGAIENAFPNSIFPVAALHEFLTFQPEQAASTIGFIGGLLQQLMAKGEACLWISNSRTPFPPALTAYSVDPGRFIFIDLKQEKDILWATEEALKCEGLAAVIAEISRIDMTASRRLQLAVEKSGVTGFILRNEAGKMSTTMATARWQISPLPSIVIDNLPGVGFPRWKVELLKVRNGKPGSWNMEWADGHFNVLPVEKTTITQRPDELKAG